MAQAIYITEDYLRQHFNLAYGAEIQLEVGSRFTPAAEQLIKERNIFIKWRDDIGQIYIAKPSSEDNTQPNNLDLIKVHPLTSNNQKPDNRCVCCGEEIQNKPALLTHLNNELLVNKNHPRIKLRGKLDSCICYCVILQTELSLVQKLQGFLADIRSYLGQVLQAEVTEKTLTLPNLGEFTASTLHLWSHSPLRYLGHDHLLANQNYGVQVAKLNYLRAMIRELEIAACESFIDQHFQLTRPDIISGLNRLSSAVYVLMILVWQCQKGNEKILGELVNAAS